MKDHDQKEQPATLGEDRKFEQLDPYRNDPDGTYLTSDQGLRIDDTTNSLKAGVRGPSLIEDFHLREKITHFDHERIPERVVHARGSGAHGFFQVYEDLSALTMARFLREPAERTPVFVRFSTVLGSRGSADTVRDVRGFAVKFYTKEGNFDLVGNNIPVFFIQDGIQFPDVIHAGKPEPHHEIPGASTAHDTFWDFISLTPESMHMIMWVLSDRAIPRSLRMMQGFGVHTFRLVNDAGKGRFVKFHWRPLLGVHSLVWEEAQQIAGKDPDYHRRDLWQAIARGAYPEYELGLQIVEEDDEHAFDFDLLDSTKIIPEELVPVRPIGKLTLHRNPDNFFTQTEQVAFHLGNVVPGIDFTNDPLLHARLHSYLDTQLTRLGGPNFTEIPINRPLAPVHNFQQDGFMRQKILVGRVNYNPNTLAGGCPMFGRDVPSAFRNYTEKVEGHKVRQRSPSFHDHFTQARLFYESLSPPEQRHLIKAARFELGRVEGQPIRARMAALMWRISPELGQAVAEGIGVDPATAAQMAAEADRGGVRETVHQAVVAVKEATDVPDALHKTVEAVKGAVEAVKDKVGRRSVARSPALSQLSRKVESARTRRVAVLVADGYSHAELEAVLGALNGAGAWPEVVAPRLGEIRGGAGGSVAPVWTFLTGASVLFDAVYVPAGAGALAAIEDAALFVRQAYMHCKPIAASGDGLEVLRAAGVPLDAGQDPGLVLGPSFQRAPDFASAFLSAIAGHRSWDRELAAADPAATAR